MPSSLYAAWAHRLRGDLPAARTAFDGEYRAQILAQVGESDAALAEIERLLTRPSPVSVHALRPDPRWDPIRDQARFRALLVKYAGR